MNIVALLSSCFRNDNLSGFVSRGTLNKFTLPVEKQKDFLNSLGVPKDDFERSYFQYLCHCQFQNKKQRFLPNAAAFFVLPIFILWCLVKGVFVKRVKIEYNAIADKGTKKVAPETVNRKYHYTEDLFFENYALKKKGLLVIMKLVWRYPLSTFFVTKLALKIAYYEYMINKYSPEAIIVENEYSYTSSVLTYFCECYNVRHVDVMHGEKLFFIHDTFFRYHECYVWSEHYIKLFLELKAANDQFIIDVPESLKIDCSKFENDAYKSDFKYYLCRYNSEQLRSIVTSMEGIKNKGNKVVYRPHPFWSDIEVLESIVDKDSIEYPKQVSIQESISNTDYAVGSYTTVLTQAFYSGKQVVLDDITYKEEFDRLKDLSFSFDDTNSIRLSKISKETHYYTI